MVISTGRVCICRDRDCSHAVILAIRQNADTAINAARWKKTNGFMHIQFTAEGLLLQELFARLSLFYRLDSQLLLIDKNLWYFLEI